MCSCRCLSTTKVSFFSLFLFPLQTCKWRSLKQTHMLGVAKLKGTNVYVDLQSRCTFISAHNQSMYNSNHQVSLSLILFSPLPPTSVFIFVIVPTAMPGGNSRGTHSNEMLISAVSFQHMQFSRVFSASVCMHRQVNVYFYECASMGLCVSSTPVCKYDKIYYV